IVHRDIKPDNIFVTTSGVAKILDFGLARIEPLPSSQTRTESSLTRTGTVLGTVSYMSPEQAKGEPGDARSDIFSLGTVLFEILSGRHPFRKSTSAETMTAILRDDPPRLTRVLGSSSRAIDQLVRRCLEKRPEARFQSAHDLAVALELLASGESDAE